MKHYPIGSALKLTLWVLLVLGALSAVSSDPPNLGSFQMRLETPPVVFAEPADGMARITLEGFGSRERQVGAPEMPVRTLLVAIPMDATPRLSVVSNGDRLQAAPLPRPVGRRVHRLTDDERAELNGSRGKLETRLDILRKNVGFEFEPDPELYESEQIFPEQVAWLGEIGVLRHQRYVELHVAPVRWDAAAGKLRVVSSVDITVDFDGSVSATSIGPDDSRFEAVYRNAFANYEQGRYFRRSARNPAARSKAASGGGSTTRYKLKVRENGAVRLDYTTLQAMGVPAVDPNPNEWKLVNRGQTVPLEFHQTGVDPNLLEPGEWVQFYGQAVDNDPETVLNTDFPGTPTDLFDMGDFTDTNVYFLEVGGGVAQTLLPERDAAPACGGCATPQWFLDTRHEEVEEFFFPLGPADPWHWAPALSTSYPPSSRVIQVPLPGLLSGSESADVEIRYRGLSPYALNDDLLTDPDHLIRVTLTNALAQQLVVDDDSFDGRVLHDQQFNYDGSGFAWTDPVDLLIEVLPVPNITNDLIVDYVEVTYKRGFTADNDRLDFEWPDGDEEFVVGGLSTTTNLAVYELGAASGAGVVPAVALTGLEVSGAGPYSVRFRMDDAVGNPTRRFLVVAGTAVKAVTGADFVLDTVLDPDLKNQATQADMIVIAHPDVLDLGPGACVTPNPTGCLTELLAYRETPAGGGLTSRVVLMEDLEDEFNQGLAGPPAIQEFLRWVMSDAPGEGWADPKPSMVMLLGDASFAYKDGTAAGNFVPTQIMFKDLSELGYYSSDNSLAAVVGADELADLMVGRISARSTAEANKILEKILSYELSAPGGNWRNHAITISDRGHTGFNPGEADEFRLINDLALSYLPPAYSSRALYYYHDYYNVLPPETARSEMRADIKSAVNGTDGISDGAAVLQYIGHGNFSFWSDDSYMDVRFPEALDTDDFVNNLRLPWMLAHNCLTGGFHITQFNSMAEEWLRREGGGSVGVFAPTGLSFNFIGQTVTNVIWSGMFGNRKLRNVSDLVMATWTQLCTQGSLEACQHYVLLGDPATRLALRSVEAPSNLAAGGGDAQVSLSWEANPEPGVTYDIYRFDYLPIRLYEKVNTSPIAGTSFVDTTVENATTYYYHLIAVDPDGFESAWSNFNSDCTVSGPDCVDALPLNPNPPSPPSGITIDDPGLGTVLNLSWLAPPQNDLASYTLHYGTQSGVYTESIPINLGNSALVASLTPNQTYYFAMTATNTSDKTSGLSAEVSESPIEGFGFRGPDFIDDLFVVFDGADALLEWSEISTDSYGKPTNVTHYEILRATAPDFGNSNLTKIADCASPCSSYRDVGALLTADSYVYRVRAGNSATGLVGGLGSDFPRWTTLRAFHGSTVYTDVLLDWDPVLVNIDGTAANISHYLIYASDQPFTRKDIFDGLVTGPTQVNGTSIEFTPPGQDRFYSVLAVDVRGNMSPF